MCATRTVIGLGSNIALSYKTPIDIIVETIEKLHMLSIPSSFKSSRLYRTPAWPKEKADRDPFYVNAAVEAVFPFDIFTLHQKLKDLETDYGRTRIAAFSPRTLDLDILFSYSGSRDGQNHLIMPDKKSWFEETHKDAFEPDYPLVTPHPRAHKRSFVLKPILDISKDISHPCFSKKLQDFWLALPEEEKEAIVPVCDPFS